MALNPYFQQGAKNEQSLVQSLINEQLRMYGVEVHYLPRKYMTENTVIREVIQSKFDDAYPLEAYVDTYDGYAENPVLMTKFGIEGTNEVTLTISRERWETYIEPLMKNEANVKLTTRPKEGDLVYFPLGDRLFEIKYVEHEKPFYQLQKTYVYQLRCELFRYEDEVIDTGIAAIDDELVGDDIGDGTTEDGISTILGVTQTLTMVGAGVTAAAYTGIITSGAISYFKISNRGGGYAGIPTVGVSSAPSGGVTGIATAEMIGGIQYCNLNVNSAFKSVQAINIINPGAAYTVVPGVQFTNTGDGSGVAATSFISDNTLGIVTVTASGSGFTTAPTVTFPAPDSIAKTGIGTTAAALSVMNGAGKITDVWYTNTGSGYTTGDLPIYATFSLPGGTGSGNFIFNEIITGGTSETTARVRVWNSDTNVLEVTNVSGTFVVGEVLTGASSGATHTIRLIDTEIGQTEEYADNFNIETEADKILDFTEANPFGTP